MGIQNSGKSQMYEM